MPTIKIENCVKYPYRREEHDSDPGLDGYTKIFCTQSGNFLGERKTRWLANGYSHIDVPNDCPLNEDEEDYDPD